jgi:hypothetical protein
VGRGRVTRHRAPPGSPKGRPEDKLLRGTDVFARRVKDVEFPTEEQTLTLWFVGGVSINGRML